MVSKVGRISSWLKAGRNGMVLGVMLFSVALLLRLLLAFGGKWVLYSDMFAYDRIATRLAAGQGYGPSSFWPPLYPYFLSLIYRAFDYNLLTVRICQGILSSVTCVLMYMLGRRLAGPVVGVLAGIISVFSTEFLFHSQYLFTQILFIFLEVLFVLLLVHLADAPSVVKSVAVRMTLGLAALTKSMILICLPLIPLWLWLLWGRSQWKKGLMTWGPIVAATFLVILPWTVRNYRVHHELVLIHSNTGVNFWLGHNPHATGGYNPDYSTEYEYPWRRISSETERERTALREGLKFMVSHPKKEIFLAFRKLSRFWSLRGAWAEFLLSRSYLWPGVRFWVAVSALYIAMMLSLSLVGIAFTDVSNRRLLIMHVILGGYLLVHIVFVATANYLALSTPFLIILMAQGILHLPRLGDAFGRYQVDWRARAALLLVMLLVFNWCLDFAAYFGYIKDKLFA